MKNLNKGYRVAIFLGVLSLGTILIFQNCAPTAGNGGLSIGPAPSTGGSSPGGTAPGAFTVSVSPTVVAVVVNSTQRFLVTITGGAAPYTYNWFSTSGPVDCLRSANSCDLKFGNIGFYQFTVTVTDSAGRVASSNSSVSVTDGTPPPCPGPSMGNIETVSFDAACGMTVNGWAWSDLGQGTHVYLSTSNVAPGYEANCETTVSIARPDIKAIYPCVTGNSGFSCKINNIMFTETSTVVVTGKTSTAADAPAANVSVGIPSRCIVH